MDKKVVYYYVLDTLADWEPGYVLAELNTGRFFKKEAPAYTVKTVSLNKEIVTTMGGVKILPDLAITEIDLNNAALLLLPGGDTWHDLQHQAILQVAQEFLKAGKLVAAICGATEALARAGILNHKQHTSNDLSALIEACPDYTGKDLYLEKPAVTDGNLITASGLAPLDYAYHILNNLEVFSTDSLEAWYQLHRTREPEYYFALAQSLPEESANL